VALAYSAEHEPLGHSPMKHFFRSLKNEWIPMTRYPSFIEARMAIARYITGYYNQNGGLTPNEPERLFWQNSKIVANLT